VLVCLLPMYRSEALCCCSEGTWCLVVIVVEALPLIVVVESTHTAVELMRTIITAIKRKRTLQRTQLQRRRDEDSDAAAVSSHCRCCLRRTDTFDMSLFFFDCTMRYNMKLRVSTVDA
jgi:hypothetical protein